MGSARTGSARQADPVSGRREVLVKVAAVALNDRDRMLIESGRGLPLAFPFTPGSDLSGQIVGLGEDAGRFALGERVISTFTPEWIDGARPGTARTPAYRTLGGFLPGVLPEYVALPEQWLVASPARLDDVYACTLPCAGLTAWLALVERGGVSAGETVLIPGSVVSPCSVSKSRRRTGRR
jgi:NADPH:quinone reductase-like Zn-dependent oxidoreductase